LGEKRLLVDLLQPPIVLLVLLVQVAEFVIRLDQLRLQLVVLRNSSASLPVGKTSSVTWRTARRGPVPAKRESEGGGRRRAGSPFDRLQDTGAPQPFGGAVGRDGKKGQHWSAEPRIAPGSGGIKAR